MLVERKPIGNTVMMRAVAEVCCDLGNLLVGCDQLRHCHLILRQRSSLVGTDHVHAACAQTSSQPTSHGVSTLAASHSVTVQ